jgi:nucleoside-diphosphate-sugar epimerase
MKRVVILGANGQVGNELCPLLVMDGSLHVTAVTRSEFSQALLQKLGVSCVVDDGKVLPQLLSSCDVLVDLALPSDKNVAVLRRRIVARAEELHRHLRAAATVVYASTMSVFHLDPYRPRFTTYGRTKLLAERTHRRLGRKTGHDVFVLRLGQVHGLMQSCSLGLADTLAGSKEVAVPDIPSFTVFVSSIAEAIGLIAAGRATAGTYTLISEPPWSWREVVDWWASERGASVRVHTYPVKTPPSAVARSLQACRKSIMGWADHHRERLATYLWYVRPTLAERLIANRYLGIARQQIASYQDRLVPRPIAQFVSVPGTRFPGLTDPRQSMPPRHAALKTALKAITAS